MALVSLGPTLEAQISSNTTVYPSLLEIDKNLTLPLGWEVVSRSPQAVRLANSVGLASSANPDENQFPRYNAQIVVFVHLVSGHADAVTRLSQLVPETRGRISINMIEGWPGITWNYRAPAARPGEDAELPFGHSERAPTEFINTVVAAGPALLRFCATLAPSADRQLTADASAIVNDFLKALAAQGVVPVAGQSEAEIKTAKANVASMQRTVAAKLKSRKTGPERKPFAGALAKSGAPLPPPPLRRPVLVRDGPGEVQVAVSSDGQRVVVVTNTGVSVSPDGGQSFSPVEVAGCPAFSRCLGDPSVAVGASGQFYYSWLTDTEKNGNWDGISVSDSAAQSFQFLNWPVSCTTNCYKPDQPQLAVDQWHTSATGKDRVYLLWRHFTTADASHPPIPMMTCSSDGGHTWMAQPLSIWDSSGDFPRPTVAPDGSLFVVFIVGQAIKVSKYSPCDGGLSLQPGFPMTVAPFQSVSCPIPGLDRCNDGNAISSPTVAVDGLDKDHIYIAWATSTTSGKNDDVMVIDSIDGGNTFRQAIRINAAVPGRRFMPWIVTDGSTAYVNWYDRRSAIPKSNDLTRYYGAVITANETGPVASNEQDISGVDDMECANLWPKPPRSQLDATTCNLPQLAGICSGTSVPCDFKRGCLGGRECEIGLGRPKFGDYNGLAARGGRRYSVWSSTVLPAGVPPPNGPTNPLSGNGLHVYIIVDKMN
jgi:hypothetical protein